MRDPTTLGRKDWTTSPMVFPGRPRFFPLSWIYVVVIILNFLAFPSGNAWRWLWKLLIGYHACRPHHWLSGVQAASWLSCHKVVGCTALNLNGNSNDGVRIFFRWAWLDPRTTSRFQSLQLRMVSAPLGQQWQYSFRAKNGRWSILFTWLYNGVHFLLYLNYLSFFAWAVRLWLARHFLHGG